MAAPQHLPIETAPLPPRYFRWYLTFWHVVYLGGLTLLWFTTLWEAFPSLGTRELALTVLVIGQVLLYIRLLMFTHRWPLPRHWMAIYFLGSLALWFIEWQLEPNFLWLAWSYFGQMLGILPPIAAIPGTFLIYCFLNLETFDWDLSRLSPGGIFGIAAGWVSIAIFYLFVYNITRISSERGHLISQLKAAQHELEAAHQRDSELAVLRERERLARDLHDSLGHALVSVAVQLEAIQRLYKVDPERASTQVDELKTLTRHSMDDLRRSLEGLRAPGLAERQLSEALQALCIETGQSLNLAIECQIAEGANGLSPAVAETIWRTTQEALTNIGRHSQARRAAVALTFQANAVTLCVSDNGVGLPPDAEGRPGHYGLRGIRERVEGLGGKVKFLNGDGTILEATIPLVVV